PGPSYVDLYLSHPHPLPTVPQELPKGPIDIGAAVRLALENFPTIRAARARAESASAGVDLSNTAYLPRVDLLWQEIRATRNNISGTTLPNPVLPGISGPVGKTTSWDSQWGSNGGALLSWEPFDFGYRSSQLDVARSHEKRARAEVEVTRLEVATQASEAFLALLASQEVARAAKANVDRWDVFVRSVHVLVNQQLRPGADASRADAELAQAEIQLARARQVVERGTATMIEALGYAEGQVTVDPGPLLRLPLRTSVPSPDLRVHPLAQSQAAAVETAQSQQKALDDAYYPRFYLQGGLYGRGSGFDSTGAPQNGTEGLLPDRGNWFAGVSVYFPVFDIFNIGARRSIEEGAERAERAKFDHLALSLKIQERRLQADLVAAQEIATKTPVQLKAAQDAQVQATIRYQNGLGTITEVAEAQQLLARAEIDDVIARISIWRVLSQASQVQGDISPFLKVVENTLR
ncbi:MAG TPA: TolC family protein, partial [Planctomycetota bacterium]|nr:TolC family protein [Planctomycetota bacterium]